MTDRIVLTWERVHVLLKALAERIPTSVTRVYGVPRGGAVVSGLLARHGFEPVDLVERAEFVVDDIVDSGRTRHRWREETCLEFDGLVDRERGELSGWIVFPWEERDPMTDIEDTVVRQLEFIGEDPNREGLVDTPRRVIQAFKEMTSGYDADVAKILLTSFTSNIDEMVVVRGIEYGSLCEHHLLSFVGTVDVAYIPNGRVVGLSKIPRLVKAFASRLQIQERMTEQIADALNEYVKPLGVGVLVRGYHSCCSLRGVRSRNEMVTSVLRGVFREPKVRAEFLQLIGGSS